jgi:hypothetical protein
MLGDVASSEKGGKSVFVLSTQNCDAVAGLIQMGYTAHAAIERMYKM